MTSILRAERLLPGGGRRATIKPFNIGARRKPVQDYRDVHPIIRFMFYGFLFSLLFEWPNRPIPMEVPTLAGFMLIFVSFLQPKICYREFPKEFRWFIAFVLVFIVIGIVMGSFSGRYFTDTKSIVILFFQIIMLSWIGYNLMKYEQILSTGLLTLVVASVILSYMQVVGIARTVLHDTFAGDRYSVLGQNPNVLANNVALCFIILISITLGLNKGKYNWLRYVLLPLAALQGLAVLRTGSRGGILALGVGMVVLMSGGKTIFQRIRNILFVGLAVWALFMAISQSSTLSARYNRTYEQGNMAGREDIYPAVQEMFKDKPLLGWGPTINLYELQSRAPAPWSSSTQRDTHNLAFDVLTSSGIAGAFPMFTFFWLCLRAAGKARHGSQGILPLSLILTIAAINNSGNWIASKFHYMVLAYALASVSVLVKNILRRPVAPVDLQRMMPQFVKSMKPGRNNKPGYAKPAQPAEADIIRQSVTR